MAYILYMGWSADPKHPAIPGIAPSVNRTRLVKHTLKHRNPMHPTVHSHPPSQQINRADERTASARHEDVQYFTTDERKGLSAARDAQRKPITHNHKKQHTRSPLPTAQPILPHSG